MPVIALASVHDISRRIDSSVCAIPARARSVQQSGCTPRDVLRRAPVHILASWGTLTWRSLLSSIPQSYDRRSVRPPQGHAIISAASSQFLQRPRQVFLEFLTRLAHQVTAGRTLTRCLETSTSPEAFVQTRIRNLVSTPSWDQDLIRGTRSGSGSFLAEGRIEVLGKLRGLLTRLRTNVPGRDHLGFRFRPPKRAGGSSITGGTPPSALDEYR